jgi:hypothetical protein
MTDDELHDLIAADPDAKAKADAGDDIATALRSTELAPSVVQEYWVTERGIFAAFADPIEGETVLQTLEAVAQSESLFAPIIKRALKWLTPSNGGINVGHPGLRILLDQLVAAKVFSSDQVGTIKALAEVKQVVSPDAVSRAWGKHRPQGKVSG